ncbi:H-NS family nucleoid-associated regulatory protein [Xanthobacter sp. VTT E-85241]|uniref:H-NS histone family protein n=1 Tax=Roseixanthobacter finlandensis TaxID=3119922 RepID=UPI0037266EBB
MASKTKETTVPDFSEMSLDELQALVEAASAALEEKKDARRQELMAELEALGGIPTAPRRPRAAPAAADGTRAKPAVKYRGPNGEEWSGRGALPRWAKDLGVQDKVGLERYKV